MNCDPFTYATLASYFEKAKMQEEIIDASQDINIFGWYIFGFMI